MSDRSPRTAAEWTAVALSTVVLAGVISLILVQMRGTTDPAAPVAVAADEARPVGHLYHLDVTVRNEGDETAANVQVSAELVLDGEVVASADQTIDFLAGDEEDELVFVFEDDPANGELTVAVTGFERP